MRKLGGRLWEVVAYTTRIELGGARVLLGKSQDIIIFFMEDNFIACVVPYCRKKFFFYIMHQVAYYIQQT